MSAVTRMKVNENINNKHSQLNNRSDGKHSKPYSFEDGGLNIFLKIHLRERALHDIKNC